MAETTIPDLAQIVAEEGFIHLPITIDHDPHSCQAITATRSTTY